MLEKEFLKSVIYNRHSYVYIWYLVASWACEVIVCLFVKEIKSPPDVLVAFLTASEV